MYAAKEMQNKFQACGSIYFPFVPSRRSRIEGVSERKTLTMNGHILVFHKSVMTE
jgi:hypothetical protein